MPTTFKILGQTTGVAATTSPVTLNLVRDSSFSSMGTFGRINGTAGTNRIDYFPNSNYWAFTNAIAANTGNVAITESATEGVAAAFGAANSAIGFRWNASAGSMLLGYGYKASASTSMNSSSSTIVDFTKAIPVTGGQTYYFGISTRSNPGASQSMDWVFRHWDSSGTLQQTTNWSTPTSAGSWTRATTSVVANSAASYITFYVDNYSGSGSSYNLFDGITFASTSTLQTSYVEPKFPAIASTTSPFDKKTDGSTSDSTWETPYVLTYAPPLQTLYTCPASNSAVVSTVSVTNLSSVATNFRLIVQKSGETLAAKHFIVLDQAIGGSSTEAFTIGITLNAGDMIKVASDTATVSFSAFGSEIS